MIFNGFQPQNQQQGCRISIKMAPQPCGDTVPNHLTQCVCAQLVPIIAVSTPEYMNRFWSRLLKYRGDFPWYGPLFLSRFETASLSAFRSRTSHTISISIEVNPDRRRFRYSGVDTAIISHYSAFQTFRQSSLLHVFLTEYDPFLEIDFWS